MKGHYADFPNDPMTVEERQQVTRMMSDPLNFPEEFTNWLDRRQRANLYDILKFISIPGESVPTGDWNACSGTTPPLAEWSYKWGPDWSQNYTAGTPLIGTNIATPFTQAENPNASEHAFPAPQWIGTPPRAANFQYWLNQGWTLWAKCETVFSNSLFSATAGLTGQSTPAVPNTGGVGGTAIASWFVVPAGGGAVSGANWTAIGYTGPALAPCVDMYFILSVSAGAFSGTIALTAGTIRFQWRKT